MTMKLTLIIGLILFSFKSLANFNMSLLAFYQSQAMYRGAVIWPKGSAFVGPMLIFYEKFFVAGPNVFYSPFKREDQHEFRMGLRFFDDDNVFITFGEHEKDYRNTRKNTLDLHMRYAYKFGFRNKFRVGFRLAKEAIDHKGLYTQLNLGAPLLPFTSLAMDLGLGEKSTNQYIYGSEGESGLGHWDMAVNAVYPFVPWNGMIMLEARRSWVLQGSNKNADRVRGDDINDIVALRVFWNSIL